MQKKYKYFKKVVYMRFWEDRQETRFPSGPLNLTKDNQVYKIK